MADAVIEFYDTAGHLTVAAGFLGFICRRSGSGLTAAPNFRTSARSIIYLDLSAYSYPIVLFQCDEGVAQYGQAQAGSMFACQAAPGSPYNYFIFDWTPNLPVNPEGIVRMWRQDGTISFDSGYWPLKLVTTTNGGGGGMVSAANGAVLAAGTNGIGGHRLYGDGTCYDGGGPVLDPGDGLEGCRDIRGVNDGKLYGARTTAGGTACYVVQVSYDDLEYSYGSYSEYVKQPGTWESDNLVLIGDVAGIPIGQTFF